ncbi:MAG TPA: hypothetical protein VF137_02020 [Candidatus Dormibacteraeota bacterium]
MEGIERMEARQALDEIGRRQQGVIDRVIVPRWYWWFVSLGMVGVGIAADTQSARVIVPAALVYGLVLAAANFWYTLGLGSGAKVGRQLLGPAGAVGIVLFIWVVVGVSLGVAFGLRAAGLGTRALRGQPSEPCSFSAADLG